MTSEGGAPKVLVFARIIQGRSDSSWHTAHCRPRPLQTSFAFHAWLTSLDGTRWIASLADFLLPRSQATPEGTFPLRLGRVPVKRQEIWPCGGVNLSLGLKARRRPGHSWRTRSNRRCRWRAAQRCVIRRPYAVPVAAIRQGLLETGFVEGQNLAIEYRHAGGSPHQPHQ
jgi:hypothetical protein